MIVLVFGSELAQYVRQTAGRRRVWDELPHTRDRKHALAKPRRYTDLYVPVREAFKAVNLYDPQDKPGLHMLRRSFASHLLSGGMDLQTVMTMGGQRYLATTDDLMRRASGLLEVE